MDIRIITAEPSEYEKVGQLMIDVYSHLHGFPTQNEQPSYYKMLANIGDQTHKPGTEILTAVDNGGLIHGGVVYYADMQYYGSGGLATQEKNAAGFRFLAVSSDARGLGIGKLLTMACVEKAKIQNQKRVVIHTTKVMQRAWEMYEKLGFQRALDLDFMQGELAVFGFRLPLYSPIQNE